MQAVSGIGRIAALGAVIGAIVLVAIVLFSGGGGGYTVRAQFINAAQLVKGNEVQVAGTNVGSIQDITVTPDGQAEVEFTVNEDYAPLREGTTAVIRQFSLSGIANRYIDLTLPTGPDEENPELEEGALIDTEATEEPVDLDQVFNIFDPVARVAVQDFFEQSAVQLRGKSKEARLGYQYLNPALSTSSRLFRELNRDTPVLEAFLVDSANLVTTVAERRDDLAALIGNLNETTNALGDENEALAEAIARFPDFMRTANTTFVGLRSTLDTLDPLVTASEPVVSRPGSGNDLQELLPELRRFVGDAEPAVADLDRTLVHPGKVNDLKDLQESFPPLASAALDTERRFVNPAAVPYEGNKRSVKGIRRAVGRTRGAFPEIAEATTDAAPIIAQGRPYTPDLWGWFDDFSHPGGYDALAGVNRAEVIFNESSLPGVIPGVGGNDDISGIDSAGSPQFGEYNRCPGAAELPAADGSNIFSLAEQRALDCKEADRATGNYAGNSDDGVSSRIPENGGAPPPTR
jgi:phospholipid/cholesterol/gamma-HCH transport system substrate-binding protein